MSVIPIMPLAIATGVIFVKINKVSFMFLVVGTVRTDSIIKIIPVIIKRVTRIVWFTNETVTSFVRYGSFVKEYSSLSKKRIYVKSENIKVVPSIIDKTKKNVGFEPNATSVLPPSCILLLNKIVPSIASNIGSAIAMFSNVFIYLFVLLRDSSVPSYR